MYAVSANTRTEQLSNSVKQAAWLWRTSEGLVKEETEGYIYQHAAQTGEGRPSNFSKHLQTSQSVQTGPNRTMIHRCLSPDKCMCSSQ